MSIAFIVRNMSNLLNYTKTKRHQQYEFNVCLAGNAAITSQLIQYCVFVRISALSHSQRDHIMFSA